MTTSSVQLNPGETLMIKISSPGQRPTFHQYTHEELVSLLNRGYRKKGVSRRSQTQGSLVSRQIALLVRAMRTGQWSTGSTIDTAAMAGKLVMLLEQIDLAYVYDLTENAAGLIHSLIDADYHTSAPLRAIAQKISEHYYEQ